MLKLGYEKNEINVVSDQIGSPTYASDLVETILHIISNDNFNKKNFGTKIFHFSNMGQTSRSNFAKEIFKLLNLNCKVPPVTTDQYPTPALRPKNTTLSKKKITNHFEIQVLLWKQECPNGII